LHGTVDEVVTLLHRSTEGGKKTDKTMLSLEGKYLVFSLDSQEFGIDISHVREIIGMLPIHNLPKSPPFFKGVVNLRDKVIPVMDLRLRFGMEAKAYGDRTCIIVLDHVLEGIAAQVGIVVDSVKEVGEIKTQEIEDTPSFGMNIDTSYILAMTRTEGSVKILLDMERLL
jgi:purine-binding chemotaxis protein CheW